MIAGTKNTHSSATLNDYEFLLRFVITGDSSVGKSALLLRFCEDTFAESHLATIGVDFRCRTMAIADASGWEKTVRVQLWDTAGQERFRTIISTYYRGSHGVVLVYDVTNRDSFDSIARWFEEAGKSCREDVQMLLIGNKNDAVDERQVSYDEGLQMASQIGCEFIETSAKTAMNVTNAFERLTHKVVKNLIAAQNVSNAYKERANKVRLGDSKLAIQDGEGKKDRLKEIKERCC